MTLLKSMAVMLGALALVSCEKNEIQDLTGTLPGSRIRFFNYGVNAPSLNFYAGDTKITAILSATGTESVLGVVYGGVGAGGAYSAVLPGPYVFTGKVAAATDKDLVIATVSTPLVDGKAYSFYVSGFYNTVAKSAEAFVVEDPFDATIDFSVAYVRFVNAISNANPMILYAKNTTILTELAIGDAVAYKGAGGFIAVPNGVYDISTRYPGVATAAISRAAVSFSAGKVYSVSARGDITITSATATNRPTLDNTANR